VGWIRACSSGKSWPITSVMANFTKLCMASEASAGVAVNETLKTFAIRKNSAGDYRLGYTLYVPLLKLLWLDENKNFIINPVYAKRIANTIREVKRPVILYLFSDHFGIDSPFEEILAKNQENILQAKNGPFQVDKFGVVKLFPWSFVNTGNR
jgi:hypothetical protein